MSPAFLIFALALALIVQSSCGFFISSQFSRLRSFGLSTPAVSTATTLPQTSRKLFQRDNEATIASSYQETLLRESENDIFIRPAPVRVKTKDNATTDGFVPHSKNGTLPASVLGPRDSIHNTHEANRVSRLSPSNFCDTSTSIRVNTSSVKNVRVTYSDMVMLIDSLKSIRDARFAVRVPLPKRWWTIVTAETMWDEVISKNIDSVQTEIRDIDYTKELYLTAAVLQVRIVKFTYQWFKV